MTLSMCDKVHGAGSAASARLELGLQGKGWDSSEGNSVGQHCKNAVRGMLQDVLEALAPKLGKGGNVCYLSSYFCVLM